MGEEKKMATISMSSELLVFLVFAFGAIIGFLVGLLIGGGSCS